MFYMCVHHVQMFHMHMPNDFTTVFSQCVDSTITMHSDVECWDEWGVVALNVWDTWGCVYVSLDGCARESSIS